MVLGGYNVLIEWGYVPITKPAIAWHRAGNGNWKASDRGAAYDTYEADVNFRGTFAEMQDLEQAIFDSRDTVTATFSTGEEIFGADIDLAGNITVSITDPGATEQVGYDVYTRTMRLRLAQAPSFTGTAAITSLRLASFQSTQMTDVDTVKDFAWDKTAFLHDLHTDPGIFEADFTQTHAEATAIRRYLLTTGRASAVAFPSIGIDYPFGYAAGSGPFTCKVVEWSDTGRKNYIEWGFHIKLAREF